MIRIICQRMLRYSYLIRIQLFAAISTIHMIQDYIVGNRAKTIKLLTVQIKVSVNLMLCGIMGSRLRKGSRMFMRRAWSRAGILCCKASAERYGQRHCCKFLSHFLLHSVPFVTSITSNSTKLIILSAFITNTLYLLSLKWYIILFFFPVICTLRIYKFLRYIIYIIFFTY